jgi:hypothetical protein
MSRKKSKNIILSQEEKQEILLKSLKSRGGRPPAVIPDKTKYNRKRDKFKY